MHWKRKKRGTTKMRKEKCKRFRKNVGKVQAGGLSVESVQCSPRLKSGRLLWERSRGSTWGAAVGSRRRRPPREQPEGGLGAHGRAVGEKAGASARRGRKAAGAWRGLLRRGALQEDTVFSWMAVGLRGPGPSGGEARIHLCASLVTENQSAVSLGMEDTCCR